ncbi:MAG: BBP7 family outer membrane beta-barrel protein [Pirellula sp.]|jgi:hypothetical protein
MKINRTTLSLIIASLCGTCASASAVGQDGTNASTGRIGDQDSTGHIESSSRISDEGTTDSEQPVASTPVMFQSPAFDVPGSTTMVGAGCESGGTTACRPVTLCNTSASTWVETETLLWWGKGMTGTPLIVGGPANTVLPNTVLGGGPDNPVGDSMRVGYRFTAGTWLDCDQNYGVMGRVFGLFGDEDRTTFTGQPTTGIRFFDTSPSVNNVNNYLVQQTTPAGNNTGDIIVENELDLVAADASFRLRLLGDGLSRGDLLAGYSFLRLDSSYGLQSVVLDGITGNGIPDGTVTTTIDTFGTRNEFHGGHLGFLNEVASGRFSLALLGKVAMGNMRSTRSVAGSYTENRPQPAPDFAANRGLFAQSTNIGVTTQDRFTFIPEAGAKLKYQLGRGQLGIGYTLLVMPSVVLAANQIDTNVSSDNFALVPLDPPRTPVAKFQRDTFFLHGLDLGYTFNF